jgi:hypothetical protein
MISTVTTSTISVVTSVALAGSVALIGILVLLALLIQKELAGSGGNANLQKWSQRLNVAIVPLLIVFVMIVAFKVFEVLK